MKARLIAEAKAAPTLLHREKERERLKKERGRRVSKVQSLRFVSQTPSQLPVGQLQIRLTGASSAGVGTAAINAEILSVLRSM